MKRNIRYIVIHCTGESQQQTVKSILSYWKNNLKWKNVGYHRIIDEHGKVTPLADFNQVTNGVQGYNKECIHICYIGGQHVDNRTMAQKATIKNCIFEALKWVDNPYEVIIQGHRDFEGVRKNCPQFNAKKEYEWITV